MERFKLQTHRLVIRPLLPTDVNDFHLYRSNPEVTRYQGFDVMSLAEAEHFIQDNASKTFGKPGEWVQYAIANKHSGKVIGDCAVKLDAYDTRIAEIGITISHLEQNKGFAKECLSAILEYLFEVKKLHRVVEIVDVENMPSIRLLKSLGFRLEGHFIENIFFKGKWGSEYQFAMLQSEWTQQKRNTHNTSDAD
ncbi:GNAT family N-acetyltransferase [Flavobacterium sp.]|uniref:GNAT family N-acetyltransferase n=1 Tax=Flavobacterium sp. TaxID=239 RepID=UPI002FDD7812